MVKWIALAILLLPLVEIGVFVVVAAFIGLAWALGLTLATSLAGVLLLRRGGRTGLGRVRSAMAGGASAADAITGSALTVMAGVLLLLPGFVTDAVGVLLLVPPLRRWCAELIRRAAHRHSGRKDEVIDLSPAEWRQVPNRDLEHRPERSDETHLERNRNGSRRPDRR